MGYSVRLELTSVSSINDSCLVEFVFKRVPFLEYVYFGLLYPSLIFDIFVVMCGFFYHGLLCGFLKFTGSSFFLCVNMCGIRSS